MALSSLMRGTIRLMYYAARPPHMIGYDDGGRSWPPNLDHTMGWDALNALGRKKAPLLKRVVAAAMAVVLCWLGAKGIGGPGLLKVVGDAAFLSAMLALPEGAVPYVTSRVESPEDNDEAETHAPLVPQTADASSSQAGTQSDETSSLPAVSQPSQTPPEGVETGQVKTMTLSNSGANLQTDKVHINNQTSGHTVDIDGILSSDPAVKIVMDGTPQVLIVHTHTTEAYMKEDVGYYIKSDDTRTTDTTQNVCRVGDAITEQLTSAGIVTIHDKTLHDYPSYSGSYNAAAETIESYLQKYPSIQVVIDVHRDAITQSDDTRVKPTAVIDGKNAAQCMIISGCQEGTVYDFDHWEENLKLTVRLQQALETNYPGLARSMLFTARRYNMQLTKGSFLVEVGSEANTLEEAIYTGELIGRALAGVLTQ